MRASEICHDQLICQASGIGRRHAAGYEYSFDARTQVARVHSLQGFNVHDGASTVVLVMWIDSSSFELLRDDLVDRVSMANKHAVPICWKAVADERVERHGFRSRLSVPSRCEHLVDAIAHRP